MNTDPSQLDRRLRIGLLTYGLDHPATGIARYTVEVARAIAVNEADIELVLLTPYSENIDGLESLARVRLRATRRLPAMMAVGPVQLIMAARRHRLDVVHDPIGIAPFLFPGCWPAGVQRVVTVHDMAPFVHPETHARLTNLLFRHYMPRTVRYADRIVTVSEASKRDIARFFPVEPSRIVCISGGVGERFRPTSAETTAAVRRRYQIEQPYILSVGALQARKNVESVLDAYAKLRAQGLAHHLVVAGPKAWKSEGIFSRIGQLGLREHVHLTGYVQDQDLPAIYAGADCFVFPSLYEGFGFPPLEAMACGTPVVVSNTSSLPEVVGDAGLLVDPRDTVGLSAAIARVLTDPVLANDLRGRGMARAKRFTWAAAAAAHAELYREVVAQAGTRAA